MNRNEFLKFSGLATGLGLIGSLNNNLFSQKNSEKQLFNNQEKSIIKPKGLLPNIKVGIIAPGTAVSDPDEINRAKSVLDYFGFSYTFGKSVERGTGYKSRTIKERIDDLHLMFSDSSIDAVFCLRGGYGSSQLLNYIDYELIKKNPKFFLGYSDITAMHIAIHQRTGLVTFHGPVLLSAFTDFTVRNLKKIAFVQSADDKTNESQEKIFIPIEIGNPESKSGIRYLNPYRTIKRGKATGKLTGGNLSLISALMGTPYEIDVKNKLLFLEDVGEEPFRIDRMLTQLKQAGKFKDAAGVIFGECSGCNYDGLRSSRVWDYSLGEILDFIFEDVNIPVFYGLTIGHTSDQITLPYGINAEMDADKGKLYILEPAIR